MIKKCLTMLFFVTITHLFYAQENCEGFRNGNFEQVSNCPEYMSQLKKFTGWEQVTDGTADGFCKSLLEDHSQMLWDDALFGMVPNYVTNNVAGTLYIKKKDYNFTWFEYIGQCLSVPFIAGQEYTLSFKLGQTKGAKFDQTIKIYGFKGANCPKTPLNISTTLEGQPGWTTLATVVENSNVGDKGWKSYSVTFKPSQTISYVAFGLGDVGGEENSTGTSYFLYDDICVSSAPDKLTSSIVGSTTVSQNAEKPQLIFNASKGLSPYTFTYKVNSGPLQTATTAAGLSTLLISAPTAVSGNFTYELIDVRDSKNLSVFKNSDENKVTVQIKALPQVDFSISKKCVNVPIEFRDNSTVAGGTISDYKWELNGSHKSIQKNPNLLINNTENSNSMKLTVTTNDGCSSSATKLFKVNTISSSKQEEVACEEFTWSNGITYKESGVYTKTLVNKNGCDSIASLHLTINKHIVTKSKLTACLFYTWTDGKTYTQSGVYQQNLKSIYGCDSTVILELTIRKKEVPQFSIPTEFCAGALTSPLPRISLDGISGKWSPDFNPNETTTYTFEPDAEQCAVAANSTIVILPLPKINVETKISKGCGPIEINFIDHGGQQQVEWDFGNGNVSKTPGNQSQVYSTVGCYSVTYTATLNGCKNSETLENVICVEAAPKADFTTDSYVVKDLAPTISFQNTSENASQFEWFVDKTFSKNEKDMEYTFESKVETHEVMMIATNNNGCADTSIQTVSVEETLLFYVPSSFTPDGDNFNAEFKPVMTSGFELTSYELAIFNRWGESIFVTTDCNVGWDGKSKGENASEGVYSWVISFKDKYSAEVYEKNGHVTLIR